MTKPLYVDPVVEDIHRIREHLLEECGGDVAVFRQRLRERQAKSGRVVIHGSVGKRTNQMDAVELK